MKIVILLKSLFILVSCSSHRSDEVDLSDKETPFSQEKFREVKRERSLAEYLKLTNQSNRRATDLVE